MSSAGGQWNDLSQRLISGGIAALVGIGVMWIGGAPFQILVAIVSGIMVWEVARMVGAGDRALLFAVLAGLVLLVAALAPGPATVALLLLPGALGAAMLARHRIAFAAYATAVLVAGAGLVAVRGDFGFLWMVWLALIVIASDILGYFAGRLIGGPKFWPRISPKKTWSGTVAGWVGAVLVAAVYIAQGWAGAGLVGISVAVAIAGQMGDIAESALKRRMGVKDSSSILPGHGGMFDRFDSLLGASIFLMLVQRVVEFPPVP